MSHSVQLHSTTMHMIVLCMAIATLINLPIVQSASLKIRREITNMNVQTISLGSACSFSVLGNQAITSTGLTQISGDVGIHPNGLTSVTGFGPAICNGSIHGADDIAQAALADARTAYNTCKSMTTTQDLTGADLGGMVITAGVYSFSSSVGITGTLTLDGQGNSHSLFVFQIGSTLITATAAVVKLINGARASNIFWQVGSSATFGTSTTFSGIVLAYTSITMNSNVAANGGMFALGAAVTMIDDTVKTAPGSCSSSDVEDSTVKTVSVATTVCTQPISLKSACSFSILGNQAITSTGLTQISGNIGIYPNGLTSITGFGPAICNGSIHGADDIAQAALADARTAYNTCKSMTTTENLTGADLGGMVITAGVYSFSSSVGITGTLTLDGQGDSHSLFVFQIGSTLITATAAVVKLINGARASNIFWQVGSSATFGTSTTFSGIVLAYTSITMNSNVAANGGMFALGAAVTMIDDTVKTAPGSCNNDESCASSSTPTPSTATSTEVSSTHAPSTSTPTEVSTTQTTSTQTPSTAAPTEAPTTQTPSTAAPTEVSTTKTPSTAAPTEASTTKTSSTAAPTEAPTTQTTSTQAPSTAAPTEAPTTQTTSTAAPTEASTTQTTSTETPSTAAPTETSTTQTSSTAAPAETPTTQTTSTAVPTETSTTQTSSTAAPTEAPTTQTTSTQAPSTAAPTEAPTTQTTSIQTPSTAAPTEASTTQTPSTAAPTEAPTTQTTSTQAPSTAAPTEASTTQTPSTAAPTEAPTTQTTSTQAPSTAVPTEAPTTETPSTAVPTEASTTQTTSTETPSTAAPTEAPTTQTTSRATPTEAPTTETPSTAAPTEASTTQIQSTAASTEASTTQTTSTQTPSTAAPTDAPTTQTLSTAAPTEASTTQTPSTAAPTEATSTQTAPTMASSTAAPTKAPSTTTSTKASSTSMTHNTTSQSEEIAFSSSSDEYENKQHHSKVTSSSESSASSEDEQKSRTFETWPSFNQGQPDLNLPLINRILAPLTITFNDGASYDDKCSRCARRRAKSGARCLAKKICYGCKA